ncbi:MAG: fatty acid--CoA ligase [Acidimicrobiaceae bacterium]|jgi:acyl-CoA synthetase (AMP-forming)/AMP-acid ligase II|nr:fatty acid--CoA ligase [Acidimicrobiaceae bacterium]|tara:strand:- start:70764 stop:72353 length:1590 start_codon:yes stop_codon:yes gene_type:complete
MESIPWRTIPELIEQSAEKYGDQQALVDGALEWSFEELKNEIYKSANALIETGVRKGDRVGIWAPNTWEWVVAALGVHVAGGVLVPINTRFKGKEASYVLTKANVSILFTVTDFLETNYVNLLQGTQAETQLNEIIILRGTLDKGTTSFSEFLNRGTHQTRNKVYERAESVDGDDLCHIMFTSGTTGAPKGAMLKHSAVVQGYNDWADIIGLQKGDRYLIVNPFFHSFGLNAGILACLMKGACILPHPVFDVQQVMERVPQDRITMLPGPPAIYQTILNHPELKTFDMTTLRLAVTGAAAIPVEMIIQMRERLGFEKIVTGYGLTEGSGLATMCRHDDDPETIAKTSGRAMPGMQVKIVDEDGNELRKGEPGEIIVKGYNIMVGYLDDPEQTAEAITDDGWLHTGDIGVMDSDGNIAITDRKKDMYINGGFNVYPAEVEATMLQHPQIGQVSVVGAPDARMGEIGYAFVVPASGETPEKTQLLDWCKQEMANYKCPREIVFVKELPLNASGKVLKYELREIAEEMINQK